MQVIRGRVFYRGRLEALSLGIGDDGRIDSIKKTLRGDSEIDHGDALILPGCIDVHVHMRDPGLTNKEDFPSGTRSAAIGGVTTIAEMPNTKPPVTTPSAFERKTATLRGRASVDFLLYAAPRTSDAVPSLRNAAAFKVYMAESTGELEVNASTLAGILQASGSAQKLVAVHAEDAEAFTKPRAPGLEGHSIARPKESEVRALNLLGKLRGETRVHVTHVTCVEALDAVPPTVTSEITPHHLFLDWSHPLGARGKMNPPLRSRRDREALWAAFRKGRGDIVASDHAPHTEEEKEGPFDEAPSGAPGVGDSFPLLMRRTRAGELELPRLISTMASKPAELVGVPKGLIEVGRDADLIAVDPRRVDTITARRLRYKCGWTPFEGMEGCFPLAVYLRGEAIVEAEEVVAEGTGRLLRPPSGAAN